MIFIQWGWIILLTSPGWLFIGYCLFDQLIDEPKRVALRLAEQKEKEEADRQNMAASYEHIRRQAEIDQLAKHKADQQDYYKQMITFGEHTIEVFELMPGYLSDAEKYLDQAEIDFADNALSPFWNCIEETATKLASFNKGTQNIKDDLSHYTGLIEKYENTPPPFPLTKSVRFKVGCGHGNIRTYASHCTKSPV